MGAITKRFAAFLVGILIVTLPITAPASALSADLANKCRVMAIKAHPATRVGVKAGSARAQRDYYRACLTNSGTASGNNPQSNSAPNAK
jgi:hypothetical protein